MLRVSETRREYIDEGEEHTLDVIHRSDGSRAEREPASATHQSRHRRVIFCKYSDLEYLHGHPLGNRRERAARREPKGVAAAGGESETQSEAIEQNLPVYGF